MGLDRRRLRPEGGELEGPRHLAEQEEAGEEGEPAGAGDEAGPGAPPCAPSSFSWSKPISRYELTLVSSQKTKSAIASSASTRPSMAAMKKRIAA